MTNSSNLTHCIALITGAGSGIGRAIAEALAGPSTTLWLAGRVRAKLESVAGVAERSAARVRCFPTDLALDAELLALATELRHETPHLDILVHAAGEILHSPFESAAIGDFDRQFRINVRAPYLLTQSVLPLLRARSGQIVFINSSAGWHAPANVSQYAATKHALRAVADSLRQEVNADGIRVLSVYPGRTASPMQATLYAVQGRTYDPAYLMQPADVAKAVLAALSLPRTAEVTDLHLRPLRKAP